MIRAPARSASVLGAHQSKAAGRMREQGPHDPLVRRHDPGPDQAGQGVPLLHEGGEQHPVPFTPEEQLGGQADALSARAAAGRAIWRTSPLG